MDTRALTRPAAPRKLRITLTAGQATAAAARSEVRAAIRAWNVPVDPSVAVLLTSELVTNALRHEAGRTIELVVSCAYGQLQVDVYDTSPTMALPVDAPPGAETGRRADACSPACRVAGGTTGPPRARPDTSRSCSRPLSPAIVGTAIAPARAPASHSPLATGTASGSAV